MTVGVYQILNTATGKSYVGSSVCIAKRVAATARTKAFKAEQEAQRP